MQKQYFNNKQICLKFIHNDLYFEKNSIIQDKTCPNCKKLIFEEKDFCDCGFFLKAQKNSIFWSAVLAIWLVVSLVVLVGLIKLTDNKYLTFNHLKSKNLNFNSLSPLNIQVISSLKNSKYNSYIQNIYIMPQKNNELRVLIKPSHWDILPDGDRKELLKDVLIKWQTIYKNNYPNSTKEPKVSFANSG